jgi:hypothetical protein
MRTERQVMSILDIAEDPRYQMVVVAVANDDAVIMYKNIKPALSRNLLIQAIHMLEGQLESTEITNGNTLGKQEPPHVAHSFEKAS